MEVHHHPHVEKKNFKEYFLEFLMIFLAVTMGFIAESVRENISNKEHAKLLTQRLVKDMKTDTLNLQRAIDFGQIQLRTIDTLYFELQKPLATANTKLIQQLTFNSYALQVFSPSTGAISAIEKELNIKQFANSELPVLMARYKGNAAVNKDNEDLLVRLAEENLQPFIYAHFTPVNAYNVFAKGTEVTDAAMRNLTQENMTEFSIKMENMGGIFSALISIEASLKAQAVKIIQYSTKQYHLEDAN